MNHPRAGKTSDQLARYPKRDSHWQEGPCTDCADTHRNAGDDERKYQKNQTNILHNLSPIGVNARGSTFVPQSVGMSIGGLTERLITFRETAVG